MNHDEQWMADFNERVKAVQIEFDAFLKSKNLSDCYDFHRDENGRLLSLHFPQAHALPKEIEQALTEAFLRSKPKQ